MLIHALTAVSVSLSLAQVDGGTPEPKPWSVGAYAEALYSYNFNAPSNGITNARGFDNRHNSFTLSNVEVEATVDFNNIVSRVALQAGHTPATYYLGEPAQAGSAQANGSSLQLWQFVQEAWAGYRFNVNQGLLITGGLFLSPIGPESMAVKDNWQWSRSNLFFGLPFYHTGARAQWSLSERHAVTLGVVNGWNSVVDNNAAKSVFAQYKFTPDTDTTLSLLYFTGIERSPGSPEGQRFRHLFDAHLTRQFTAQLALQFHLDGGFEVNHLGVSSWVAGAVAARWSFSEQWFAAARIDGFFESVPTGATPIFWSVPWVSSATLTAEFRPVQRVSFRLEYRHDQAAGPLYFAGRVSNDSAGLAVPNAVSQDTLTLGVTSWF